MAENEIEVDVTTTYDGAGVEEARTDLESLDAAGQTVEVKAETSEFDAAIADLMGKLEGLRAAAAERAELGLSTNSAQDHLDVILAAIEAVRTQVEGGSEFRIEDGEAEAKLAALEAQIAALKAQIDGLSSLSPKIDVSGLERDLTASEAAAASLGQALGDTADDAAKFGQDVEGAVNDVEETSGAMGALAEALGNLGAAFGRAADAASGMAEGMGNAASSMFTIQGIMMAVLAALPVLAAGFLGVGAAMAATVIGAGAILMGMDGIKEAFANFNAAIAPTKEALSQIFDSNLTKTFSDLADVINKNEGAFGDLAKAISDVVKALLPGKDDMQAFGGAVEDAANFFEKGVAGASALKDAIGTMSQAAAPELGDIADAISSIYQEWDKAVKSLSQSGVLQDAFEAGAKAIEAFGKVLAAVGTVLTEIAAKAGPALAQAFEDLADALVKAAPDIAKFVEGMADIIAGVAKVIDIVSKVLDALGPVGQVLAQVAGGFIALALVISAFTKAIAVVEGIIAPLAKLFGGVGEAAAGAAGEEGLGALGAVVTAIAPEFVALIAVVAALGVAAVALYKNWDTVGPELKSLWDTMAKNSKDSFNDMTNNVSQSFKDLKSQVQDLPSSVGGALGSFFGGLTKIFHDFWTQADGLTADGLKQMGQNIQSSLHDFTDFFKTLPSTIGPFFKQLWSTAIDLTTDGFKQLGANALNFVKDFANDFMGLVKTIGDIASDIVEGFTNGITKGIQTVGQAIGDFCKSFIDDFKQALGVQSPSTVTADIGKSLIDGLVQGITQGASQAINAVVQWAKDLISAVKGALGIQSPSTEFHEVGMMMMAGWQNGINAGGAGVHNALSNVARGLGTTALVNANMGSSSVGGGANGQQLVLQIQGGSDSAVATMIASMARSGRLKISSRAIV